MILTNPFDFGCEARGVFLDISKAIGRVWWDSVMFKLEQHCITGTFCKLLHDFQASRMQIVVLNGQVSSWANVKAGVPQSSIFFPLLFLINFNDLQKCLSSNAKLFADNTPFFSVIHDSSTTRNDLNDDFIKIISCAYQWKISFDPETNKQAQEVIFK